MMLRQYLLGWTICNFQYSTVSDYKKCLCHMVQSSKSIKTICQKVKTVVPQLDSGVLSLWTQMTECHFLSELPKVTSLGPPGKHFDLNKLFFQCSFTHFWIVVNIKSKDSAPRVGHLLLPSSSEVGRQREICPLPAYHSLSHSHTTALLPSLTAPRQA